MPSFDIKSEINSHELQNGVDQANRIIDNRFDFKGSGAKFSLEVDCITSVSYTHLTLPTKRIV